MQTNSIKHHIRNCMKGLFLVVLLSCLFVGTSCSDAVGGHSPEGKKLYFPARYKGLWGYIDQTGKMVIEPQFQNVGAFSEGKAPVCVEVKRVRKWGFINEKGEMVIEPQFERASSFSEGLAAVLVDSLWGYIDQRGEIAIEPKIKRIAGSFHYGRAYFRDEIFFGFIDRKGNVVIEPQYELVDDYFEGVSLARVGSCAYGNRGFIDTTGNWVIPPVAASALPFRNGIARVAISSGLVYINHEGKILNLGRTGQSIDEAYENTLNFTYGDTAIASLSANDINDNALALKAKYYGGLYPIQVNNLFGFADSLRNIVIEPQFFTATPFQNGVSKVVFKDWKMGYIDQKGNIIYKEK